ncbi:MAG: RagB/SusD family nutrient uptake outer membrane protein, partial [Sphingobacteriales bacterium]
YGNIRNSASEPYTGDGFQSIPYLGMNMFRSDDQEIVSDPGASGWHSTYDFFQYTKDDWGAGLYWDKHYVFIGLCNTALALADSLGANDANSIVNIAEARFFRAYAYFDLVKNFGQVPLIDFPITQPSDAQVAKSPEADIYALIDADLDFASANLPGNWDAKYKGRLTTGAAKTLHAKTYMFRSNFGSALTLTKDVMASGEYQLVTPYWSIWKTAGENGPESIFEVQSYVGPGGTVSYWSHFGTSQGVRGSDGDGWNLGWGWNTPTADLVNSYEAGDPRKNATILFSGQSDDPANGGYGRTVPPYTNALYWNKKVYTDPAEQAVTGDIHGSGFVNQRVLRYADVILMAAEAANEIGGADNILLATENLEMIRARARNGNNAILPPVAYVSQAQMRTAIQRERRSEFAMEAERFYDLVRWNLAQSVLAPLGYTPKHRLFPLPASALTSNPKLVQNPDWP